MGVRTIAPIVVVLALVPFACSLFRQSEVEPRHAAVRYVGRFDLSTPDAPRFAWPASELRITFAGRDLRVRLTDTPVEDETRETDWVTVFVDGKRTRRIHLSEGTREYEVARDLGWGVHQVRLVKRTEAEVGTITFHGFVLGRRGSAIPTVSTPRHTIEVIGDSISAGYGNEGPDETCHWSARTEDASRTYATFAAAQLDADVRVLAWSGKGVLRNYDPRSTETMRDLVELAVPTDRAAPRTTNEATPDAVVINLGTNDFFPGIPDEGAFVSAYEQLLTQLRARAPRAPVFVVLGPMLADDYPHPKARSTLKSWLARIVAARSAKGERVELVEQWSAPDEGVGCDFHPSVATHRRLGTELATAIRNALGA